MDIERAKLQLAYFTEGATPDSFMTMDKDIPIESVRSWERNFNDLMAGNSAERRRVPFLPAGTKAEQLKPPPLKDEFDEWIARKVCFAFSIPPNAFTKQMNRASAESEHDRALEEGLEPIKKWVKKLIDNVIKNDLKITGYEFAWLDDREQDAEVQDNIIVNDTKAGIISINEARDKKGLDPLGPDFDKPMALVATGYVPISSYNDQQEAQAKNQEIAQTKAENPPPVQQDGGQSPQEGQGAQQKLLAAPNRLAWQDAPAAPKIASGVASPAARKAVYSKVGKAVRHKPIPFRRPTTEKAISALAEAITPVLKKTGDSIVRQLKKVVKADDDSDDIAAGLDLSSLNVLADVTPKFLADIAKESGMNALIQIGVADRSDIVGVVDDNSLLYAKSRGAELIGMKWDGDSLIPNPDAEWRIDETTRGAVKDALDDLYSGKIEHDDFYDTVASLDVFSPERAEMISRTEIQTSNGQGSLMGYKASRDNGVKLKKEWLADDEACDICRENEDAGAIDLDDEFPSGDDAPTAHPNCECVLSPVVEDDSESDDGEDDGED